MSIVIALQAQAVYEAELLHKPNVVGVAVGRKNLTGDLAVVTLVQQKLPLAALSAEMRVPKQLDGVLTDVVEVGYLRAYDSPRDRFRPAVPCGVSIGHYKVTAGTLGVVVYDTLSGQKLLLSNNHVLANSNDAQLGDAILQPGTADGGTNNDVIARLERFMKMTFVDDPLGAVPVLVPAPNAPPPAPTPKPVEPPPPVQPPAAPCDLLCVIVKVLNALARLFGSQQRLTTLNAARVQSLAAEPTLPTGAISYSVSAQAVDNQIDAALAKPVIPEMFTGDIHGIGVLTGTKGITLGQKIRKSGRTTGYTEGTVTLLNATVNVGYGNRTARFNGQVVATPLSQGGDSGSLIVDGFENKAVGLLFAGSNLSTIFTPIDVVLNALNVRITP